MDHASRGQLKEWGQSKNKGKLQNRQPPKVVAVLQEVVVYERFNLQGFDWENFGVLDKKSLFGGCQ